MCALLAEIQVAHRARAGHVAQVRDDVWEMSFRREFSQLTVFVAVGTKKSLLQRQSGRAVGERAVAHVRVAVVKPGDHDEAPAIELVTRLASFDCGDRVFLPRKATSMVGL